MKLSRLTAAASSAALAVLVGHVTDKTTGQPLPGVTITIGPHHATTDAHGAYRLTGLAPGHYTMSAGSKDVPPQNKSVDVKQSIQTMTLDLVLCSTTLDYSCAAGPG